MSWDAGQRALLTALGHVPLRLADAVPQTSALAPSAPDAVISDTLLRAIARVARVDADAVPALLVQCGVADVRTAAGKRALWQALRGRR